MATGQYFIQAGTFRDPGNASSLRDRLASLGPARIDPLERGGDTLYRVRVGPLASAEEASGTLARVHETGLNDARIVSN
jgi:rare lipoprotein A